MKELFYDTKVAKLEIGKMRVHNSDVDIEIKDSNVNDHELTLRGWIKEQKPTLGTKVRVTIQVIE